MGHGRKPTRKGGLVTAVVFCAVLVGGLPGVSFAADGTSVDASSDPADAATAATSTVGAAAAQSTDTAANTATDAATNTADTATDAATNTADTATDAATNTAGNAVNNAANTAGNAVNHGAGSVGPASNSGGPSTTATEGPAASGTNAWTGGGRVHDSSGGNASAAHDAPGRSRSSAGGVLIRRLGATRGAGDVGDISTLVAAIDQVSAPVGVSPAVAATEGDNPLRGWFFGLLPYTGVALFVVLGTSLMLIFQGIGMVGFGYRRRQRAEPAHELIYTR